MSRSTRELLRGLTKADLVAATLGAAAVLLGLAGALLLIWLLPP